MRGARVVAIRFTEVDSIIPASVLSHHPSLWRLEFDSSGIPPLRALARYTQLHGLRELVCWQGSKRSPSHELQHVQPLSQLEVLDIRVRQTAGAEGALASLPRLRELNLSGSDLRTVPASMASLTRLTHLSLTKTRVSRGWQHLAGMQQLSDLSVWKCNLTAVPPVFSQLTALTYLSLHGNAIASGWQHLSLLPLHKLWTDDPAHCFI